MKKMFVGGVLIIASFILVSGFGFFDAQLEAPGSPPYVKDVPDNWEVYQKINIQERNAHIAKHQYAYNRFADFAQSETDGIPYILLKLLPKIAPEYWGKDDDFLSVAGLFYDERLPYSPVPRGMGFSGLSQPNTKDNIDYASFACGACHIGRMRLDDNSYYYLDGGANSEFNIVGFRKRLVQTITKVVGNETDLTKQTLLIKERLINALDQVTASNPNFFYKNFTYEEKKFDSDYEQNQIRLFRANADKVIAQFIKHHVSEYEDWKELVSKFYKGAETELLDGLPGMEDAIGFNTIRAYSNLKQNMLTRPFAPLALPAAHGITDIMVVWEQNKHDPVWDSKKTNLINGGGQWTGHIPLPIYKNIAAQLTIGYDNSDIRVSAFSEEVLDKMPVSVYPFEVDIALAKKGQALFAENCASCHQPNNGKVYRDMGTDMGRATMVGFITTLGAVKGFTDVCGVNTTVKMHGQDTKPCSHYKGVSLEGKEHLSMTSPRLHTGYNALPLVGIWAQAPYLHNGSIPTLYHLLVPDERPSAFIKSRLDYDKKLVGFSWDSHAIVKNNEGYLFDTRKTAALSNKGHDTDIVQQGKTFKLNWSNDKAGAWAIIEYLKTL